MQKYLYNNTEEEKVYVGKTLDSDSYYEIPVNLQLKFSMTEELLVDIANGDIIVSTSNDIDGHITNISKSLDFLKGNLPTAVDSTQYPFASKVLADGSNIFRRVRGVAATINNASINIDFTVPYTKCKITGLQIIGASLGDKATFQVLDTSTGTISGVPNAVLNTFGQNVYVAKDLATYPSKYDADLFAGLVLRIVYDAADVILDPARKIYINFDLHEVISP